MLEKGLLIMDDPVELVAWQRALVRLGITEIFLANTINEALMFWDDYDADQSVVVVCAPELSSGSLDEAIVLEELVQQQPHALMINLNSLQTPVSLQMKLIHHLAELRTTTTNGTVFSEN